MIRNDIKCSFPGGYYLGHFQHEVLCEYIIVRKLKCCRNIYVFVLGWEATLDFPKYHTVCKYNLYKKTLIKM